MMAKGSEPSVCKEEEPDCPHLHWTGPGFILRLSSAELKHRVQLLPWSLCDSASPSSEKERGKESLPPVVVQRKTSCVDLTQEELSLELRQTEKFLWRV